MSNILRDPHSPSSHRIGFFRRLLFPYSGDQVLTFQQGRRVILTWVLFFGLALSLGSLPVELALMQTVSLRVLALSFLLSFLAGGIIFGGFALLVVAMNNQAARFVQQRKQAGHDHNTSGGRHGS
ncbi:MAG: hypothetical protein IMW89_06720 [Ktedonobacteraceae bacterium]|nr:hypothetical protein [Ktedonobacteraceae bacterium]